MQLSQLEYFIKVAECGSITKAAQELYLSQPCLTKAISNLEGEYNIQLFKRTAKGINMTADGQEFLDYARNAVAAANALENTFRAGKQRQTQRLHIASQQLDFLYEIIGQTYCDTKSQPFYIDLEETDQGTILKQVRNRETDIGLLVVSKDDTKDFKQKLKEDGLDIHILDNSHVYVSMGEKCPFYHQKSITTIEASTCLHVLLDAERSMKRRIYLENGERHFDYAHLISCNSIMACLYFLRTTGALLYTPKWVLNLLNVEGIRTVLLTEPTGSPYQEVNTLVWVKRSDEDLSPMEEVFIQKLNQRFRKR